MSPVLLAAALILAGDTLAFANVKPGDRVENARLPALGGGEAAFLGEGKASLFLFFSLGQDYSLRTLETLSRLEKELEGKPISWVAIVSDRHPVDEVQAAVKAAGLRARVLVDPGDELYGRVGGALTPCLGIVDAQQKLVAYLPFQKIGYEDLIRGWLRRTLGEISEEELQKVIAPPPTTLESGSAQVARRHLKMAERLLGAENFKGAAASARRALDADPQAADAHALLGAALAGEGNCDEALASLEKALALQPGHAGALAAKERCAQ